MEDRTNRRGNGEVMAVHGGFEAEHEDDVTFVSQLNYRSHDVISSVLFRESPSLRFTGCVKAGEDLLLCYTNSAVDLGKFAHPPSGCGY